MRRGVIWSVIVLSVFVLSSCQKKAKEETSIESQTIALDEASQVTATPVSGVEGIAGTDPAAVQSAAPMGAMAQQATSAVQDTVAAISAPYEKPSIEKIQEALRNTGLYSGSIDGKLGPKTKKALEDFQTQNNLTADGKIGPKTWARLSQYLTAQNIQPAVTPEPAAQNTY